jgi:predicted nucleotidyltransferase
MNKRDSIHSLLDSLNEKQIDEFMSWAHPRLTWYADANILHSEAQLDEIIAGLERITGKR